MTQDLTRLLHRARCAYTPMEAASPAPCPKRLVLGRNYVKAETPTYHVHKPATYRISDGAPNPEPSVLRRRFVGTSQVKKWVNVPATIPNKRIECSPKSMPTRGELEVFLKRSATMHGRGHK